MATKLLALTDALGNLVRFHLMPGHRFDTVGVAPPIGGVEFNAIFADKAFDSTAIIAGLNERGARILISQHPRRTQPNKHFRRIATRYNKFPENYLATVKLTCTRIWFTA